MPDLDRQTAIQNHNARYYAELTGNRSYHRPHNISRGNCAESWLAVAGLVVAIAAAVAVCAVCL